MTSITNVFGRAKVVLPVIHIASEHQALTNVEVALEADADGIFLIHHGGNERELTDTIKVVRAEHPRLWIGANYLGNSPRYVWEILDGDTNGLWADNAGIDEREIEQPFAQEVLDNRTKNAWQGLYFGGLAFKYQRPVRDLEAAALLAKELIDVPTTSGSGTGYAADLEKIKRLKSALGDHPLGIASGITVDNVTDYVPYVDAFLVATGISDDFHTLNPDLTREVIAQVHA